MNRDEITNAIKSAVEQVVETYDVRLQELGISRSGITLEVHDQDPRSFTSELKIEFYRGGELFDVLEFFVFRKGSCVMGSTTEASAWIRENVERIVNDRVAG